jgi:hypothetical protein
MPGEAELIEVQQKERFVTEWLRIGDPFKAGHLVFPADPGRAMRAAWEWTVDPEILEYRASLEQEDDSAGTPSQTKFALEVYQLAHSFDDGELKLKGLELFAKVKGWIAGGANINIDNRSITMNKVMVIKDHGSPDAWERSLNENQKRLQSTNS